MHVWKRPSSRIRVSIAARVVAFIAPLVVCLYVWWWYQSLSRLANLPCTHGPSNDRLRLPVAWVHVPKCGSTMLNAILHVACCAPTTKQRRWGLGAPAVLRPGGHVHALWKHRGADPLCRGRITGAVPHTRPPLQLVRQYLGERQWGGTDQDAEAATNMAYLSPPHHQGFGAHAHAAPQEASWLAGPDSRAWGGPARPGLAAHGVVMLRQPEQRLMAAYHHGLHSWPPDRPTQGVTPLAYARVTQGCAVKMLSRGGPPGNGPCEAPPHGAPAAREVAAAVATLGEFQFVGLQEHWALSVCLWHAMFAPALPIAAHEVGNTRRGVGPRVEVAARSLRARRLEKEEEEEEEKDEEEKDDDDDGEHEEEGGAEGGQDEWVTGDPGAYDVAPLEGFTDDADRALYAAALRIFRRNLAAFNVTEASCQRAVDAGLHASAPS